MKVLSSLVCGAAVLVGAVSESSKFEVTYPPSVVEKFKDGVVPGTPAMFGNFPFGHSQSISGLLYYADPPDDPEACASFSADDLKKWPTGRGGLIVMVDRGDCTFVTKVRHVQEAGGIAAVIVDQKDETFLPYMADDNTGGDISIPSLLIGKINGQTLKDALVAQAAAGMRGVSVKFSWNLPHPDNRVEWDFWTSSDNEFSEEFKHDFAPVAKALGVHALMTPYYQFIDGQNQYACYHVNPSQRICGNQCTNQGRYCSFDPDGDLRVGLNGSHIVRENVRQKCFWKFLNTTEETLLWWDYILQFEKDCSSVELWGESCSFATMDAVKAGASTYAKTCIDDHGGYDEESLTNTLIEQEINMANDLNIFSYPTILLNGRPYRGDLSCPTEGNRFDRNNCNLLLAICTGFKNPPNLCTASSTCPVGVDMDDCGRCGGDCYGCSKDDCGDCLSDTSPLRNKKCTDCKGVVNGPAILDDCQHCDGPGRDVCGHCTTGKDRATNVSQCGGGQDSPDATFPYNNKVYHCEDFKVGGAMEGHCSDTYDAAGNQTASSLCGASCGSKEIINNVTENGFPTWGVVLIVLGCVGVVGGGVFFYMRKREDAMRQDIDSLLKQYLPMGNEEAAGTM